MFILGNKKGKMKCTEFYAGKTDNLQYLMFIGLCIIVIVEE